MRDPDTGSNPTTGFDELADALLEQGLAVCPSRLQGCLCGLLAGGAPAEADWGLAAAMRVLDVTLHGDLAGQVLALYTASGAALDSEMLDFYPLLPTDDEDIARRADALAAWCSGFLAGYAEATAGGSQAAAAAGDSAEILRDFAAISEATADAESTPEEQESSYAELVEYVRVAALNAALDARGDDEAARAHTDSADPGLVH